MRSVLRLLSVAAVAAIAGLSPSPAAAADPDPAFKQFAGSVRGPIAGGELVFVLVDRADLTADARLYFGDTPGVDSQASPNGIAACIPDPCQGPLPPPTSWIVWAKSPAHAAGKVDLSVRLGDRTFVGVTADADDYFYDAPPAISAITPNAGPVSGGNRIRITVTGELTRDHEVLIGGQPATDVTWRSEQGQNDALLQQIEATVPATSIAGSKVDVVVRAKLRSGARPTVDILGATATADDYTYNGLGELEPRVTSVAGVGYAWVGGIATVRGVRFGNLRSVKVGNRAAVVLSKSSTQLIIFAPPLAKGSYPITVTTVDGPSAPSTQLLTYRALL